MGKSKINRGAMRRHELRNKAEAIAEERATRTPQQQIELLDQRLGIGIGAVKERKLLHDIIEKPKEKKKGKK